LKTIILLAALCIPFMAFSQTSNQYDTIIIGLTIGYNNANWEKVPAGVKTQFNNSTGSYVDLGGERHLFRNHPDWSLTFGIMESDNTIVSNALLNTDAAGKTILTIIPPNTNYTQNEINISAWGIHLGVQYDILTSKKGNSKIFIGTGYAIQFITVTTDYTTKGDTTISYSNYKNIALFEQKIIGRVGFGFRYKSPIWWYFSLDGSYALNSLFTNNDGPDLSPYFIGGSFGINFGRRKN